MPRTNNFNISDGFKRRDDISAAIDNNNLQVGVNEVGNDGSNKFSQEIAVEEAEVEAGVEDLVGKGVEIRN